MGVSGAGIYGVVSSASGVVWGDGARVAPSGRPAGWGKQQREAWEARDYHQPSDELADTWDFGGIVDDAPISTRGWAIRWYPRDRA